MSGQPFVSRSRVLRFFRNRRSPIRTLAAALLVLTPVGLTSAYGADERRIETFENQDFFGHDLRTERDVTLEECKSVCLADGRCKAFTYNTNAGWCFLKSDFSQAQPFLGAVSGRVVTVAAEPDIGPAAVLSFLPEGYVLEATRFRTTLPRSDAGFARLVAAAQRQMQARDYQPAIANLKAALSHQPDSIPSWLDLARAAADKLNLDGSNDWQLKQTATAAALNAYQLTRTATERAQALDLLAKALETREQYRAALESYKESLALVDSQQVLADFQELKARKGFRVVEHVVEADGRTGRICVRLSDPLVKSGVDYASFVTVDDQPATAINASGNEVCVEGLEHGREYHLTLRPGLPAAVGEVLERPIVINAYVRDRAPSVRFTGDSFVLPNSTRHGIPVVSVNTSQVEIRLYRIGDRSLASLLSGSQFLRQLDAYDASGIRDDLGEEVWEGTLDVSPALNAEVITGFPVDEALPERRPGVYVMTATAKGAQLDNWSDRATQWFVVSDIGLSTYTGADGMSVFARSFATAEPSAGVTLKLLARNNEVLGEAVTDDQGRAHFPSGYVRGQAGLAPAVLTAADGNDDFVFLDLTRAGFDLSDRGVTGRPSPGPIDLYAWTERGIYRAGETVHLAALARDDAAAAIGDMPLTFIVTRPDGKESQRFVETGGAAGGYELDLDLPQNAMHGAWTVGIHSDPDGPALSEKMFLVEDFRPDRIEFDLDAPTAPLAPGDLAEVGVDGRYLYGAPASGLALEADLKVKSVRERADAPGFLFGLAEEDDISAQIPVNQPAPLDAQGQGTVDIALSGLPASTRLLVADLTVRMREGGGRAVERNASMPVSPAGVMIGVRPQFANGKLAENTVAGFQVAAFAPDGARQALGDVSWSLKRIERHYQWYSAGGRWRYEPVEFTKDIDNGRIVLSADAVSEISVPVGWGRYRLDLETDDAMGPATSVEFTAGWYVSAASTETPDGLEIALDGESYEPGQTAKLNISPRFAGVALITVANDRMREVLTAPVPADGAVIDLPVGDDWGAGAYVTVTLFRPGDDVETRLPSRAIGVKWLTIDPGDRVLDVALDIPDMIRPDQVLSVPVTISGAGAGEARFTLAAVDVGILNLTAYEPPDPEAWYFGQRRLGIEIRDLFGRLIDGSQGVMGAIRTGGDGPGMVQQGSPPKQKLVSLFSGVVETDENGEATVDFAIPQFNGSLKLMAVAWTAAGVGQANRELIVRDPVVITTSLPKFLAPEDVSELRIDLANTDGPAGPYTISVDVGEAIELDATELPETIELARGEKTTLVAGLKAIRPGVSDIVLHLSGPDGLNLVHEEQLGVRPGVLPVTTRMELPLAANGGSAVIDSELLAASYLQGATVTIDVSGSGIDVPALLMSLDRYPYGCAEQTTSRALPLLYLSELDAPESLLRDVGVRERVEKAIARVLSYQSAGGSFGLWGPGEGDLWLDSYVSDFLTRAVETGYDVPDQAMRLSLDNLQNRLSYTNDLEDDGDAIAYALYVLARNKRASAGDLRYYADTRIGDFSSAMARAQIAAALSIYGDVERSSRAFDSAWFLASGVEQASRQASWFASPLRDDAAMLALAGESRPAPAEIGDMIKLVSDGQRRKPAQSTQEQAWMLLAARAVQETNADLSLEVDGVAHGGSYRAEIDGEELAVNPVRIENTGTEPVNAMVTAVAAPLQPPSASGNGYRIERGYYDLEGQPASIDQVEQNQRFVAVITVTKDNPLPAQIIVTDLLPAGLEIDNPRLVDSAQLSGFSWLGETKAAHTEFRDDRFAAAFETGYKAGEVFRMAYVVRAVSPGLYTHPAAHVEDMYRPDYSARTATRWMEVKGAGQ
ncbi:alpha-2-macroglobulin family protein [Hoeflea sp. CAU 1731]